MESKDTLFETQIDHTAMFRPFWQTLPENKKGSKASLKEEKVSIIYPMISVIPNITILKIAGIAMIMIIISSTLLSVYPTQTMYVAKQEPVRIPIIEPDSLPQNVEAANMPPAFSVDQILSKLAHQEKSVLYDERSPEWETMMARYSSIKQNLNELTQKEEPKGDSNQDDESAPPYYNIILQAADQHNIDPALIRAIIMAESSYNPNAVSRSGAKGLMQLMPRTAKALGVKDILDPTHNINGGTKYLRQLLDRFNGDIELALAAYNAGSRHVKRYRGIPPFKETRNYVKKVLNYYETYQKEFEANQMMALAAL